MNSAVKCAIAAALILAGGLGWNPACSASGKLIVTGSSTLAPLTAEIARRFESLYPGIRVDVQSGGSSRGIQDVRRGTAGIGMVSRALKAGEKDLHAYTIASDGIGIIVHASNPVVALSKEQVRDIYTRKIVNWKDVGGADSLITLVNKAEGRSTLELFLDYLDLKNSDIKPHVVIGDNSQGIKMVAGSPHAIGYVSIGAAEYEAKHGAPVRLLSLGGVKATVANVRDGTFPLSRPLNLVTRAAPEGPARAFIEFARSELVNDLVEAQYFVPVGIR